MIATAIFIVWQLGRDNCPLATTLNWMTDDLDHALVELLEQQKELEREQHWRMQLYGWSLSERSDIGW